MSTPDPVNGATTVDPEQLQKEAARKRRSYMFYGLAGALMLISMLLYWHKGNEAGQTADVSRVAPVAAPVIPQDNKSLTGAQTPAYAQEVAEQNRKEAQQTAAEAASSGKGAYLPAPVSAEAIKVDQQPPATANQVSLTGAAPGQNAGAPPPTATKPAQLTNVSTVSPTDQDSATRAAAIKDYLTVIANDNRPVAQSVTVVQQPGDVAGTSTAADTQAGTASATAATPLPIKPGSLYYGIMYNALDSDTPGPAIGIVEQGPLRGAKVMGSFTRQDESLLVKFTSLVLTNGDIYTIEAYAVDPDTTATAVESSVDNHYLSRWGGLIAASFISKYGQVIQQQGTTAISTVTPGGTSTISTTPTLTNKQIAEVAVGGVAQQVTGPAATNFARPPTVALAANQGIGILFISITTATTGAASTTAQGTAK